jgi:hypothetical protein
MAPWRSIDASMHPIDRIDIAISVANRGVYD